MQQSPDGAVGQRSPRWGFMTTLTIPCENGEVYLFRRRIIQTPWFAIFLHDIFEDDGDRDPHNHPWSFISIILRGSYTENFHYAPLVSPAFFKTQTWKRWSIHKMGRTTAHRITEAAPGLKTLIITGPRHKEGWGFFTDAGFVPWQEYKGDPVVEKGWLTSTKNIETKSVRSTNPEEMSVGITSDPSDPRLTRGIDDAPTEQAAAYLVLSKEERARGFVRPVRRTYTHVVCGAATTMSQAIAETYAANPKFYGASYCTSCSRHVAVAELRWNDGSVVGS